MVSTSLKHDESFNSAFFMLTFRAKIPNLIWLMDSRVNHLYSTQSNVNKSFLFESTRFFAFLIFLTLCYFSSENELHWRWHHVFEIAYSCKFLNLPSGIQQTEDFYRFPFPFHSFLKPESFFGDIAMLWNAIKIHCYGNKIQSAVFEVKELFNKRSFQMSDNIWLKAIVLRY